MTRNRSIWTMGIFLLSTVTAFAQPPAQEVKKEPSLLLNPMFMCMALMSVVLLVIIIVFAGMLRSADELRKEKEKEKKAAGAIAKAMMFILITGFGVNSALAQDAAVAKAAATSVTSGFDYWGLGPLAFYAMASVVVAELIIIFVLYQSAMHMLNLKPAKRTVTSEEKALKAKQPTLIEKLNASVALDKEEDIMLDHNYDGIRELDNDLPPWWKYGFYFTIIWGAIYLMYYHVSNKGKLQLAEYQEQLAEAATEKAEYMQKASNRVDENNVVALTDPSSIASGKAIFIKNCAACHGQNGEGVVGPNLTDEYWLHEGGINHIFKSVKYGWAEKGMKAWQQDFGARQIQEVSSYILSLKNTNPPNAKEKQGDLYIEEEKKDTTAIAGSPGSNAIFKR